MSRKLVATCLLATIIGTAHLLGTAHAAAEGRIDGAELKPAVGGKASSSQCAKDCIAKATKLGYAKVANDSMACFLPYKGKRLSTSDCCDKAELLFGRHGSLASCLCCPEFAQELLQAMPLDKLDTTHEEYVEKMNICRVPLAGTDGCSPRVAKERAPLPVGSNGPYFQMMTLDRPAAGQLNLTGLANIVGFPAKFTSSVLAAQGRQAVADGHLTTLRVIGASDFFNDYVTGYMMLIEKETPRNPMPAMPKLPPLPPQFQEDLAWVANLRRGPMPDLIKWRPERFTPKATDALQDGRIADMSPGVVFAGRVPSLNTLNGESSPK